MQAIVFSKNLDFFPEFRVETPQTFEIKRVWVDLSCLPASYRKIPWDEIFRMHGHPTTNEHNRINALYYKSQRQLPCYFL